MGMSDDAEPQGQRGHGAGDGGGAGGPSEEGGRADDRRPPQVHVVSDAGDGGGGAVRQRQVLPRGGDARQRRSGRDSEGDVFLRGVGRPGRRSGRPRAG